MKKIGLVVKETSEKIIKSNMKEAAGLFVVKYSGLSSPDLSSLRQALKGTRARLFVVKNSVAKRALKDSSMESLVKSVEGPCGFVFAKDGPVDASKVLYTFAKEHEQLKLEGGIFEDRLFAKIDIENMAKLPTKDALRAQVVGALNAPLAKLVFVLHGTIRKLVVCLDQIKKKKGA